MDDSNIFSEAQNETKHEIEKSFTLEMVRRAKDATWDKDKTEILNP